MPAHLLELLQQPPLEIRSIPLPLGFQGRNLLLVRLFQLLGPEFVLLGLLCHLLRMAVS